MKMKARGPLYWAPRILTLLFTGFISLFALDVFDGRRGFTESVAALLMHLIPSLVLLVLLAIAWRWEWVGAITFPTLGALYIVTGWGRFPWMTYLIIAGPLFLVGGLFLFAWMRRRIASTPA